MVPSRHGDTRQAADSPQADSPSALRCGEGFACPTSVWLLLPTPQPLIKIISAAFDTKPSRMETLNQLCVAFAASGGLLHCCGSFMSTHVPEPSPG